MLQPGHPEILPFLVMPNIDLPLHIFMISVLLTVIWFCGLASFPDLRKQTPILFMFNLLFSVVWTHCVVFSFRMEIMAEGMYNHYLCSDSFC